MTSDRIALFNKDLAGGGAQRMLVHLAGGLADLGAAVDLVLMRPEGPYLGSVPGNVRLVDLRAPRLRHAVPALARYLRRERPGVMMSTILDANLVALLARRLARSPTRVVVRLSNHISSDRARPAHWQEALCYRLLPRLYPWADRLVAVSAGVADDLLRITRIPRDRVRVIPNPAVSDALAKLAQEPAGHPWYGSGGPPVVLGIGRLEPQKDFPTLVRAFAAVRKRRRARLVILGEGALRGEIEAVARSLGVADDVDLPGFVSNPYAHMRRAAVVALSSAWEGFANVLVEAMACGAPVVATDCPSGPAEILEGGRYGRLVPVGDAGAMAAAIRATLDNPPDPEPARRRALDFTVDKIARRYADALTLWLGEQRLPEPEPAAQETP